MLQVCPHCRCFFQDANLVVCVCSRALLQISKARKAALLVAGYRQWWQAPLSVDTMPQNGLPEVRGLGLVWEEDRPSISFIEFVDGKRWWMSSPSGKATVYAQTSPEAP